MFDHQHLVSGMFSDFFDEIGQKGNVAHGLRPFKIEHKIFARARTVRLVDAPGEAENIELGLGFLESVQPGEVLCVEGSQNFAYFGELMTRLSMRGGLAGAIIDGLTRDSSFVATTDFPVFAAGCSPVDIKGRGKVEAVDVPIQIKGLTIDPHDLVFADNDALVKIPQSLEEKTFPMLKAAISEEKLIIQRVEAGQPVSEILKFHESF